MKRKELYHKWIKENSKKLLDFQDMREGKTKGCFFYPYNKGNVNFVNARWQEAVLTLAWIYNKKPSNILKKRIFAGIDFWCKIQHRNGSFPERVKNDQSFAATAFSTFSVAKSIEFMGLKEKWLKHLEKAGNWLCKNDEGFFINQEAIASLALLQLYKLTKNKKFLNNAEKKLNFVLRNQAEDGYFYEKQKLDLSYSSLTLDLLGNYYLLNPRKDILKATRKYIEFAANFIYPDGSFGGTYNSRKTGWISLDGFEIFANNVPAAQFILKKVIKCHLDGIGNIQHLPDDRHICTDLYRICFAYDHCKEKLKFNKFERGKSFPKSNLRIIEEKNYIAITNMSNTELYSLWHNSGIKIFVKKQRKDGAYLNYLRFLGIHRFRKLRYFLPKIKTKMKNEKYEFLETKINVTIKSDQQLLIAYKEKNNINLKAVDVDVNKKKLDKLSIEDSIFYGKSSLNFIKIKIVPKEKIGHYSINFD